MGAISVYKYAGAMPKLIISARESSSLPISDWTLRALASIPSQVSKTMAIIKKNDPILRSPTATAIKPQHILAKVKNVGMNLFTLLLYDSCN